jgi:hypothetical protein
VTWSPPTGGITPVAYNIYRNAGLTDLAATVSANDVPLIFEDHNRRKNVIYTYYIVSIDKLGNQSIANYIAVP